MLAAAIDEKDPYTRGHFLERVAGKQSNYFLAMGIGLELEEVDRLRISALLHDVGRYRR